MLACKTSIAKLKEKVLLKKGAEANKASVRLKHIERSLLAFVCGVGFCDIARLLVDHGADVNAIADEESSSPLLVASSKGRTGIVRMLIDRGADVNATNGDGNSSLMLTSRHGHTGAARMLIDNGAYLNAANRDGD